MPRLDITLNGHLLIAGGQASALGVDLATTRRFEGGCWVPYIPATAVRGAVRIRLESLLRGRRHEVAGPYPLDQPGAGAEPEDPVARLFGYCGPEGERAGSREGCLRFSDALPLDRDRAMQSLRVRTGVELDDVTASVEDRKLFSRELVEVSTVLPDSLVFRSWLEIGRDADETDLEWLRKAVGTTFSIGAGKSTGGGEVSIDWADADEPLANRIAGHVAAATRARLKCTLLEPAHFGDGGPRGNHAQTKTYIPGATLRGAIAWALLRDGNTQPDEDEGFRDLFLEPAAASFGDALPVLGAESESVIRPLTVRERRDDSGFEDVLVRELARAELNSVLQEQGLYLRADVRHLRPDPMPARPAADLLRRIRTRVSIDRHTGTSAEGKLFSIQQIEPWLERKSRSDEPRRVTFVSSIEGLTPRGAELLAKLEDLAVFVGAGRNHGMGKVAVEITFDRDPDLDDRRLEEAEQKVLELDAAVAERRREMAACWGLSGEDRSPAMPVPLALVALSEFLPTEELGHPLAAFAELAGEPERSFLTTAPSGGYDQRPGKHREPLKTLRTAVGAGSVFVYRIDRSALRELLQKALPALRRGVGRRGESGCGRFDLFQEITR